MADVEAHRQRYARPEWERRFLVRERPGADPLRVVEIVDRYFRGTTLRLRRMTERTAEGRLDTFKLTQKLPPTDGRPARITNVYVTEREFELLEKLPGDHLRKVRYSFPPMGIDVFEPPLEGLIIAEAEFASVGEMNAFNPPSYVAVEVTTDERFTGGRLVRCSRSELIAWLAEHDVTLP